MRKLSESLPMLLLRAREATMEHFRPILKEFDVTEQQWRVLRGLYELGESNAQDLAKNCSILSPSLSRILAKLEADGVVVRGLSATDQREIKLQLSAKGKKFVEKIALPVEAKYQSIQDQISPEKLKQINSLLNELIDKA